MNCSLIVKCAQICLYMKYVKPSVLPTYPLYLPHLPNFVLFQSIKTSLTNIRGGLLIIWACPTIVSPSCIMINGKPTIVAIGNENMEFGAPNNLLSTRDAVEINALYNCRSEQLCSKVPYFVQLAHKGVHRQRGVLLEGPGLQDILYANHEL